MDFNIYDKSFCELVEKSNYQMLESVYLSEIVQYEYGTIVHSDWIAHPWYNHVYIHQDKVRIVKNIDDFMTICNLHFKVKNRKNCFYLPEELGEIELFLQICGYRVFEKENWWYFDASLTFKIKVVPGVKIFEITDNNFDDFAEVFNSGFMLQDNIDHIKCMQKAFTRHSLTTCCIGFIAYRYYMPIGTLCMIINKSFCGIYAVATVPEYRNQGVFTLLFGNAVQFCRLRGIRHIFLQTVSSDECNKVYKKCGFINIFSRIGYLADNLD